MNFEINTEDIKKGLKGDELLIYSYNKSLSTCVIISNSLLTGHR